jgi:hypothetical protein
VPAHGWNNSDIHSDIVQRKDMLWFRKKHVQAIYITVWYKNKLRTAGANGRSSQDREKVSRGNCVFK